MAQDPEKKAEDMGQQNQAEEQEKNPERKTSGKSKQGATAAAAESKEKHQADETSPTEESRESSNSLLQVLDFLKSSQLINLDIPLKSLFEQVQHIQPEPSSDWGLIGDSGHWALVWQKKHD